MGLRRLGPPPTGAEPRCAQAKANPHCGRRRCAVPTAHVHDEGDPEPAEPVRQETRCNLHHRIGRLELTKDSDSDPVSSDGEDVGTSARTLAWRRHRDGVSSDEDD